MKVLVIGSGGREHALAWKLAQSPVVEELYAIPGNPGIAEVATCLEPEGDRPEQYLAAADALGADLTVVGPEAPLVAGIVDCFRAAGKRIVGPDAERARLEGSKIHAKFFMQQSKLPTARFAVAQNAGDARALIDGFSFPVVLKADGLAAGKGVIIAADAAEAQRALETLKPPLVIEECLTGEEVSFIVLSDGRTAVPFEPTQDHKAVFDGDRGPNTGGMGAYSDSRILSERQRSEIMDGIIQPVLSATGFTGFLYAGLMMTKEGPKVLEFNVRLGDPETQPLMHRLRSDFAEALLAAAEGELHRIKLEWSPEPSVCVVLASGGYPGAYETGFPITGLSEITDEAVVFHAGTRQGPHGIETAGGRVLGVTAAGPDLRSAIERTYTAAGKIQFDGAHYRTDIGKKGLMSLASTSLGY
jgi:phosphoribosylamine--glycine ligase